MRKYKKNSTDLAPYPKIGSARFTGKKRSPECGSLKLPESVLHVGELVELECETPLEGAVDSFKLIKSSKKPIVAASKDGKYVLVISADKKLGKVDINPDHPIVREATDLYTAFHGTDVDKVEKIDTEDAKVLIFWGHLNHIVYSVPARSARRGVPFIHEARDRGDDVPPADEKPIVCVSPNRDFLIMHGPQFVFTERGMIG